MFADVEILKESHMSCRIEQYPTKLFLKNIEFNKNTCWIDIGKYFPKKSFVSNGSQGKVTVDYIDYNFFENEREINVSVYFVNHQIEKATIMIPAINNDYDHTDEMDFYQKRDQREKKYQKWLDQVLIKTNLEPDHSRIMVGSDKSENTLIAISLILS